MPCEKAEVRNGVQQLNMYSCMAIMFRWRITGTSKDQECTGSIQFTVIHHCITLIFLGPYYNTLTAKPFYEYVRATNIYFTECTLRP